MRTWTRAIRSVLCGRCGGTVADGQPVQVVTLQKVKRERYRCEQCADGSAPPDLPATIERGSRTKRMTPIRKLATMADWKAKQGQA